MSLAKKLLSDRMADNRADIPKKQVDDIYIFVGYAESGQSYVTIDRTGEVLPAGLSTNGYLKPGQPVTVDGGSALTVKGMPKAKKKKKKPKPKVTIPPKYKVKILYFVNNQVSGKTEVWIGGDRKEPTKITEFPLISAIKGLIHNLGSDDKYIVSLQVGSDIYSFHSKDEFKNLLTDRDKVKRTRLNNVGHGYFAEFCDPYILPVTVPNNIIGEAMFVSIDKLFPEICSAPNVCTSSSNDDQAVGTGSRSSSSASKNYTLKPWAFYKSTLTQQLPSATRSQSGTYGVKPFDRVETNRLDQSVALSPILTRAVLSVLNVDRIERQGGPVTGSQSWSFYIKLSHPKKTDKYYTFNICSNASPTVAINREPFRTNADPQFNSSILILAANGKKIFSHEGEAFAAGVGFQGADSFPTFLPYTYEISTPIEVAGTCEPPNDLPNDGPGGLYGTATKQWSNFGEGWGPSNPYIEGEYKYPRGTPKEPRDTPPPVNESYFEAYSDRNHLHWRTLVMGNNQQVIALRSEYAISMGPSPSPVLGVEKLEKILISPANAEIVLGGMLPPVISPKDNLIKQLYYFVDDAPYFPGSPNAPAKSSIKKLDVTTYTLSVASTKEVKSETIHPIPDNAIVQNCSYQPD